MKPRKQASICSLLSEILSSAGFSLFSCGEGKMLALSRGDVCHCSATLCFAALLARAACEHMSLIRQQQCSLSLLQAQISPLEDPHGAAGPCRWLTEKKESLEMS